MGDVIQLKGGTAAEWTAANPVLRARELGIETDTLNTKIGDGVTAWNTLAYASLGSVFAKPVLATGASATVDDVITTLQTLGLVKQA